MHDMVAWLARRTFCVDATVMEDESKTFATALCLQVNLMSIDDNLHITDFIESNQWKIVETSTKRNEIKYPCCNESYVDITYSIALQRYSTFALHLFSGPSITLSLVRPVIFILPAGSNEKITLGLYHSYVYIEVLQLCDVQTRPDPIRLLATESSGLQGRLFNRVM
jgi:Neurotransmitter-gated ion-channel ligand binding domain